MIGLGSGTVMARGLQVEEAFADRVPVAGATVIAPLHYSWRNLGSAGGSFGLTSAPLIASGGATTDGVDDCCLLTADSGTDFTFFCVSKFNTGSISNSVMFTAHDPSATGGWGVRHGGTAFSFFATGYAAFSYGTLDLLPHVFCVKRSGVDVYFYLDGDYAGTLAVGANGSGIRLGCRVYAGAAVDYGKASTHNVIQYASALGDTDREAVRDFLIVEK